MKGYIFILAIIGIPIFLMLLPSIIGFIKVKKYGANIPFSSCFFMSLRKTLKEEIIKAVAYSQIKNLNIDINNIEAHFLANGNPLRCLEALEYAKKKNLQLDYRIVSAADLADKDLIKCIDKTAEEILIAISETTLRDRRMNKISYSYDGKFKIDFGRACFADLDNSKIKDEISQKISKYIEYSDINDKLNASRIIVETILDTKLWESKGLNLVSQELNIK